MFSLSKKKASVKRCTELQVLPRHSSHWPGSSARPSGFWRWSWPCGLDLPGTDPGETITLHLESSTKIINCSYTLDKEWSLRSDLQVPLDLADVVLQQEVVLQGEAAVLIVQLSQEVVEPNSGQRVLNRHRVPEETENTALEKAIEQYKSEETSSNVRIIA